MSAGLLSPATRMSLLAGVILSSLCLTGAAPPAGKPAYHLVRKIPAGGEGGWDYLKLDATARRLDVTHATSVLVFDADSGVAAGEIPDTAGVHGVALAQELGRRSGCARRSPADRVLRRPPPARALP